MHWRAISFSSLWSQSITADAHEKVIGCVKKRNKTLYPVPVDVDDFADTTVYNLYTLHESVTENFADGKVKGKSRPGRVKRAGASCDGSVTDLRARAKNASGEKAKMYHWCANMKSGRKKWNSMQPMSQDHNTISMNP